MATVAITVTLVNDAPTVTAMRGPTAAKSKDMYHSASMSPDSGSFPFYIWNLSDITGYWQHTRYYKPGLLAGATDNTAWDGNNYHFYHGETGNRVFMYIEQHYRQCISLWSCAAGMNMYTTGKQKLVEFPLPSVAPLARTSLKMEFAADKVRVLMGGVPMVSNNITDADGWVSHTGPSAYGRVGAELGATRFWFAFEGGDLPGPTPGRGAMGRVRGHCGSAHFVRKAADVSAKRPYHGCGCGGGKRLICKSGIRRPLG